jgi:hypothetical protein
VFTTGKPIEVQTINFPASPATTRLGSPAECTVDKVLRSSADLWLHGLVGFFVATLCDDIEYTNVTRLTKCDDSVGGAAEAVFFPVKVSLNPFRLWNKRPREIQKVPPDHLLLDSAPNLGPLISRWEINNFENC